MEDIKNCILDEVEKLTTTFTYFEDILSSSITSEDHRCRKQLCECEHDLQRVEEHCIAYSPTLIRRGAAPALLFSLCVNENVVASFLSQTPMT
mmetsp:Transcript_39782/g.105423  ORF Transcript_39782/g.105423 Transcript_39782/m.105423 type:complete len:93 (+) Transcript_39782:67-345(+)